MWFGLYLPNAPSQPRIIEYWEETLERQLDLIAIYQAWGSQYRRFNTAFIQRILNKGRIPLITWEPWRLPIPGKPPEQQPQFSLKKILAGKYEEYLRSWVAAVRCLDAPILLRPMHEMNGNWYPWCGTVNQNKVEDYIEAWKYLHSFFQDAKASNVQWVWSPHAFSFPTTKENTIPRYYPGDEYVDWVAIDGYNWGTYLPWSSWQSFEEIFAPAYAAITNMTQKPMLIAEMASTESGGNKAQWIRDAFRAIAQQFPRIKGAVWFNTQKECDWQIDSSQEALKAFKQAVKLFAEI